MSKKALFICLHRPNRSPSQRFRFEQYLNYLNQNGFDCQHVFLLDQKADKSFYSAGKILAKTWILLKSVLLLINHSFFKKYDLVFVQRETFMLGTAFFEKQFAKRSKLVFDLDDSIWMTQTGDIKSANKFLYFLKNPKKTQEIIEVADMVFAGNQYIADYASQFNKNVKIVPTTIDTDEYGYVEKSETKTVCIGWSGSVTTIIHFEFVLGALRQLKKKYGSKLTLSVIGSADFKDDELGIQGLPWKKETELEDFRKMDIGLMPLPDDEWTKGKCALKGLQYMSFGIPCIMSPVGVNSDIIEDGVNGFLASTEQEWIDKLSQLIDSFELRQKMGKAGRGTTFEGYSILANQELYLKYLNEVTA
ncbi:MAG: glycosyltransferase involved in cell wall biosynthesis [Bacteroidia bacterium]|jgi:glycosyltransferase involved in cell wall biosynthesis